MQSGVRAYLLGSLRLFRAESGEESTRALQKPPTLKSQSLLAYLILNRNNAIPRERLLGMFWGEYPERRARQSLSTALWHIRRCSPEIESIKADNYSVQLAWSPVWVDAEQFEIKSSQGDLPNLETALALYRGDFLEGFYDNWIIDERYRLEERYLETLALLMDAYEGSRRFSDVLVTAQLLLKINPLREDAHRAAMRAYYGLGQRNAALDQFAACRQTIRRELGIDPLPETEALFQAIQKGEIDLGAPQARVSPVFLREPAGKDPNDTASLFPLTGRESELERLFSLWEQTRAGKGSLLLIGGQVGIGKTRLVETFASQVRGWGNRVFWGRCYEFERLLPYQPFADALRPPAARMKAEDWQKLPAWVAGMVRWLLPELKESIRDSQEASALQMEQDPSHLFEGITRFLSALVGEWPVLLVLEDLHWATVSSLQMLHYLARRTVDSPLLIVGTYRKELIGHQHPFSSFQAEVKNEGYAQVMNLVPLSQEAVSRLVADVSGLQDETQPLSHRLFQETEGNPFYLVETIKSFFEKGLLSLDSGVWRGNVTALIESELPLPKGIAEVIQARAARLDEDAHRALQLAAVLGREFDFDLFESAWGKGQEATLEAVERLLRHGLIVESIDQAGRDYAFSHHKIQEVIYATIPRLNVYHLHAQVGRAMEQLYPSNQDEILSELARHFDIARHLDKTLIQKARTYLYQAGESASIRFAYPEALEYFSRAIDITPEAEREARYELLLARERIFHNQGDRPNQTRDLAALERLARDLAPEQRVELALRRAAMAVVTGNYDQAREVCQDALELSESIQAQDWEAKILHQLGLACFHTGDFEKANSHFESGLQLAQANGLDRLEADILLGFSLVAWRKREYAQVTEYALRARACYQALQYKPGEGNVLNQLGIAARYKDQYLSARTYFQQALDVWLELGNRRGAGIALGNLGVVSMDLAEYQQARAYFTQALSIRREIGDRENESNTLGNLCVVSIQQGDFTAAEAFARQALQLSRQVGTRQGEGIHLTNLSLTQLERGDYSGATRNLQDSLRISREIHDRRYEGIAQVGNGRILLNQHRYSPAREAFSSAERLFHELGEKSHESEVRLYLGFLAARLGGPDQADEYFGQALATVKGIRDRYHECLAIILWGLAALLYRRYDLALEKCATAVQIARDLAARSLEAKALLGFARAQEGLENWAEADEAYRAAMARLQEVNQDFLVPEALAGLARGSLARGEVSQARVHIAGIREQFERSNLDGVWQPLLVILTWYRVLLADGDSQARSVLISAQTMLRQQAGEISAETARRAFLENIPLNHEIDSLDPGDDR